MKVNEDGPGAQAGLLVGDKLISVNGSSLVNCEHSKAVSALKAAGDNIEMVIIREVLSTSDDPIKKVPGNTKETWKDGEKYLAVIEKDQFLGGNFGFSIAGGSSSISQGSHENMYITKVNDEDKNNGLTVGDRVLSINGNDTASLSHDEAVDLINQSGNRVELMLYRETLRNVDERLTKTNIIDNTIEVCEKQ